MDGESESISANLSESSLIDQINYGSPTDHSTMHPICSLCRITPSVHSLSRANVTVGICGHCKFLLLEAVDAPIDDLHRRRLHRERRSINGSSESIEDFFSLEFSQMMNLARLNQSLVSEHLDPPGDSDAISRMLQRTSSRSTPDGSRRWRRMSDTESDGFDNMDSLYGETESNVSFGARIFQGDSDTVSVSAYGGDSDVSMEDNNFLETETFPQSFEIGGFESDSDIDPMHTGLVTWDSDGHDDLEEEYGWEEADVEESAGEAPDVRNPSETGPGSSDIPPSHNRRNRFLGLEQIVQLGILERGYNPISRFSNTDETGDGPYRRSHRDRLRIRGFQGLLNHEIPENVNSRRGPPPAAESFVDSLPRLIISENKKKSDEAGCAICKDPLSVGNEVIQLPCHHLYHPCCILPWLGQRNSCPLCRYELPTDDVEYNVGLNNANTSSQNPMVIHEFQQEDDTSSDDDASEPIEAETVETRAQIQQELGKLRTDETNAGRGRRCFLVAARVVSVLGIVLVLWLGKPQKIQRVGQAVVLDPAQASSICRPDNHHRESKRWWHWF